MGVVSGVTMSFQFGTNWPGYMEKVGNIAGPLLAYEILTAFFLEAVFLGIMLFGFRRVSNRVHTLATFLVAFGTTAVGLLDPGAEFLDADAGRLRDARRRRPRDSTGGRSIFNPSFPYRLVHMLLASGLTVSFLIAGLSALRYLVGDRSEFDVEGACAPASSPPPILIPIQIFAGDQHGLNTLEHQPQKIAAMEANWNTGANVPLVLFAHSRRGGAREPIRAHHPRRRQPHPDAQHRRRRAGPRTTIAGNHPPVFPVFWAFRIMVGTGVLMLAVSWAAALFLRRRHTLPRPLALRHGADGAVRLGRLAGRLVHHRDRPPALAGHRRPEDRRCASARSPAARSR